MKKIAFVILAAVAISAFAVDTSIKGYLVDLSCAAEEGQRPEFGIKHSKACLQMAACAKSGYGVLTEDKRVLRFDKAGNDQAKKFIAALTKKNDIKITVTGSLSGDQITVNKIELQ
jgi:phosphoribosylamine-glycine ligase